MRFSLIFSISFFLFYAGKWYLNGVIGETLGQIFFLIPIISYSLFSFMRLAISKKIGKFRRENLVSNTNKRIHLILIIFYLFLVVLGFIRTIGMTSSYTTVDLLGRAITLMILSFAALLLSRSSPAQSSKLWTDISIGMIVYLLVNIVGWAVGVENPYIQGLQLNPRISLFGFLDKSAVFPFVPNYQSFAKEAGIFGAIMIAKFDKHDNKFWPLIGIGLFVIVGLMADMRLPFLGAFIVIFIKSVWKIGPKKILVTVFLISLLIPFSLPLVEIAIDLIQTPFNSVIDLVSITRANDLNELVSMNNRNRVWFFAFEEFRNFIPIHLIGFGAFGQIRSGISNAFAHEFFWRNPDLITMHSTYLQHLVDYGYLGLVIIIAIIINALFLDDHDQRIEIGNPSFTPYLAVLAYLIIISALDTAIYFTNSIMIFIFLLINFQIVFRNAPIARRG